MHSANDYAKNHFVFTLKLKFCQKQKKHVAPEFYSRSHRRAACVFLIDWTMDDYADGN